MDMLALQAKSESTVRLHQELEFGRLCTGERSELSGAFVTTSVLGLTISAKAKSTVCSAYFQLKCLMAGQTMVLSARHKTASAEQAT